MPNSWKDSRHATDDSSCYLYLCHKILLCLLGNLVLQGFHVPPEMEIQWCQVRWARRPGCWASRSTQSVAKLVIWVAMWSNKWSSITVKQSVTNEYDPLLLVTESVWVCLPTVPLSLQFWRPWSINNHWTILIYIIWFTPFPVCLVWSWTAYVLLYSSETT